MTKEHTATPYKIEDGDIFTNDGDSNIANIVDRETKLGKANAEFIVTACNSFDALVNALKSAKLALECGGLSNSWAKTSYETIVEALKQAGV